MCLDEVTKTNLDESGVGWKVFRRGGGKLVGESFDKATKRLINRWLNEQSFRDRELELFLGGISYPYGFHVFKTLKSAKKWLNLYDKKVRGYFKCLKVKYRKGHTLGNQVGSDVIVAKEMLILPNQLKEK